MKTCQIGIEPQPLSLSGIQGASELLGTHGFPDFVCAGMPPPPAHRQVRSLECPLEMSTVLTEKLDLNKNFFANQYFIHVITIVIEE